jgi:hypothetical protein
MQTFSRITQTLKIQVQKLETQRQNLPPLTVSGTSVCLTRNMLQSPQELKSLRI